VEARIGTPKELATALADQAREWKAVIDVIGVEAE
jgi:hypothetical protein